jgi:hypothetical protein
MPKLFGLSHRHPAKASNEVPQAAPNSSQNRAQHSDSETAVLSITPTTQSPSGLVCPSFEDEPWRSQAAALRPTAIDEYWLDTWVAPAISPPPLPPGHPYVKLLLAYLGTVPDECWIDEENDVD